MASVISTVRGRARGQASANTETTQGVVTRTYIDADKNVTAADVRLHGLPRKLSRVSNSSGIKLWVGLNVLLAWTRGSRFAPVILSAAGAEGGNVLSAAASAAAEAAQADTNSDPDLSGVGFLLIGPDETVPDGYELAPGANTMFTDVPPGTTSGGAVVNGRRTITMRPLVLTALPDAATTPLPNGTLADLVDGNGDPLGLYRLDKSVPEWKRRDAGSGGGGGSVPKASAATSGTVKTDVTETDPVVVTKATFDANKALTDATTAEVQAARTETTTAPFTGQTFASLANRLMSFTTRLASLFLRNINTSGGIQGGGNLTGDLDLSLTNTGVPPGSYTNLNATIDAKGRILSASNGTPGGGSGSGSGNPAYVDGAPYSSLPATPVDVTQYDSAYFLTTDQGASGTTANQRKVKVSLRSDVIPAPKKLWYGYVPISNRLIAGTLLTGISPQLAPGLVVGDYLIVGSDYTGTSKDPYPGADSAPVAIQGNISMSPVFFQIYSAIRDLNPILVTGTVQAGSSRAGTKIKLHKPEGLSGAVGGKALVEIDPESVTSYGTYIFRIVRITNVPTNPAQAYSGDIYELGFTLNEAQVLTWGGNPPKTTVTSGQFNSDGGYVGGPEGITPFIYRGGRQERRSPISSGSTPISVTLEAPGATVAGGPPEKRIEELLIEVAAQGTITLTLDVRQFYSTSTNQCCDVYLRLTGTGNVILQGPSGLGHTINNAASVSIGGSGNQNKVYRLTPYNLASWWGYISG